MSNIYWDAGDGRTLEQGPALAGLQRALDGEEAPVFKSKFSQEVWRSRHEPVDKPVPRAGGDVQGEQAVRRAVLDELDGQIPAMSEGIVFDLFTGTILERRIRGAAALGSMLLTDRIPRLAIHCRELIASARNDDIDVLELSTLSLLRIVAVVPAADEAIAVVADGSQARSHVSAVVARTAASYGEQRRLSCAAREAS